MPCTTILVGKKASHDGSTIIARNDDGAFEAKRLLTHPAPGEGGHLQNGHLSPDGGTAGTGHALYRMPPT